MKIKSASLCRRFSLINIQNNSLVQVNQSELLISRETVSFEMIFVILFFGPLSSQTEVSGSNITDGVDRKLKVKTTAEENHRTTSHMGGISF